MPDQVTETVVTTPVATAPVSSGTGTTEYKSAESNKLWGIIGMVLGLLTSFWSMVGSMFGHDTHIAIIAGAVVAVASQISMTLSNLGYIKSRTDIKVASYLPQTEAKTVTTTVKT